MVYGIISEFNPFHNGHKWLVDKVKDNSNAVVSVVSSSFVQRGDISIINKVDKAMSALQNGVDLVIELPAVYSLSSAETFGKAGVDILKGTGVVDKLLFGSECGDVDMLKKATDAIKSDEIQEKIKAMMDNGEYYPRVVYNSIKEIYGDDLGKIFDGANNILGIEYIKALDNTNISPITFSRKGSGHNSKSPTENIASGSYIRDNFSDKELYIPKYNISNVGKIENLWRIFSYKISTVSADEIKNLPDVNEGLENRIKECIEDVNSFKELCNKLKTKRYTMSRLRRILCCCILGITKEIQNTPPPYIRVLGFTEKGSKLLKDIKEKSEIPLITNVKKGYDLLSQRDKKILDIEVLATKLWNLSSEGNSHIPNDFKQQIIKIQ